MVPRYVERTKISAPVRGPVFLRREEDAWSRRWAQVLAGGEEEEDILEWERGKGFFFIYIYYYKCAKEADR